MATLPVTHTSMQSFFSDSVEVSCEFASQCNALVAEKNRMEIMVFFQQIIICITLMICDFFSEQLTGGTQLKMKVTFSDDLEGLWKPMR